MRMAPIYGDELDIDQGDRRSPRSCSCSSSASRSRSSSGCWPAGSAPSVRSRSGSLVYAGICVVGYFMTTGTHFLILADPGRTGAGGNAGAEPLAVRQPDPARQVGRVLRVLRRRREVRRHLRAGDLRSDQPPDRLEPRCDHLDHRLLHRRRASCSPWSTSPKGQRVGAGRGSRGARRTA